MFLHFVMTDDAEILGPFFNQNHTGVFIHKIEAKLLWQGPTKNGYNFFILDAGRFDEFKRYFLVLTEKEDTDLEEVISPIAVRFLSLGEVNDELEQWVES